MKKAIIFLFSALLVLAPYKIGSVIAADTIDQSCNLSGGGGLGQLDGTNYQTFTPGLNRLSAVKVYLDVEGLAASAFNLKVYHNNSLIVDAGDQTGGPGQTTLTYDFTDQAVTTGDTTYKLELTEVGGAVGDWYIAADTCYTGGTGYRGGVALGQDYGFTTYGWNYTAPTPGQEQTDNTDANINQAPANNTSADIKAPTSLTATDNPNDSGGKIKLDWKASTTTDIDGYKIFRSTNENLDFTSIGIVDKNTLSFLDPNATAGTKYFYFIRAYKGTKESASSNTAGAISKSNAAPTSATNTNSKNPYLYWYIGGSVAIVALGGLLAYLIYRRKKALRITSS